MSKLLCVIAIVFFSAVVKVNSLQCYECVDCTQVTNDQIATCGAVSTTVAPTTVAPGQTTTPGQVTTPAPGQTTTPGQETTPGSGQTTTPGQVTTPATEQSTIYATTTPAPEQSTTQNAEVTTPEGIRLRRAVLVQEKAAEYVCLTIKYEVNNTAVISRGCALDAGDGKICELGIANATCTSCKTDNCNGAASIQVSLILMFAVALFKFF